VPSARRRMDAILFSPIQDVRGNRVVCLPFSDYCDPLVENEDAWYELIEPLFQYRTPVRLRCLRNSVPLLDERFAIYKRAKWHAVDLTRPEGELWAGLAGQARQNIRRAVREGVRVREGKRIQDVQLFHRMHAHLRKTKYRMLAQPLGFFENLYKVFSDEDRITVFLAETEDRPLAGILLLLWRDTLYYKFNASFDQCCRANELLVWSAMLMGHRQGLARLDFGISDLDQPGLIRYKAKFATEEREVFFLEWLAQNHSDRRAREASNVLGSMTRLLTDPRVPDEITQAGGSELYRYFV
jgi:hypothetical protein